MSGRHSFTTCCRQSTVEASAQQCKQLYIRILIEILNANKILLHVRHHIKSEVLDTEMMLVCDQNLISGPIFAGNLFFHLSKPTQAIKLNYNLSL